jgi:hypothetical protein
VSCDRAAAIADPDEVDADHLAGCADCQAQLAAMRRIAHAMREVGASAKRRPDHLARVWAAVDKPPRRRWLPRSGAGMITAGGVLVAAAAVLVLWLRRPEPPPRFAIDVVAGNGTAIRGDAKLGDRLRIRAREGAVRVYVNDRRLVLECPRMCQHQELVLDAIARYQVLWIDGPAPAPTGSIDGDIAAASAAGARHELRELEVR